LRLRDNAVAVSLVLAMALVAVLLVGCPKVPPIEPGEVPPPEDITPAPTGEPIKIGGIFGMTGAAAALGQPEADTAKMIEEQVNAAGGIDGRPLQIIIRDTKGDETECLAAVKELVEKENVLAIAGPSRSGTTLGIIDYIEKAEVPLLSCAAAVKITTPVHKWVFKTPQTDADAVKRIYQYLGEKSINKVAVLSASSAFGVAGLEQLKAQAEAAGITIVAEEQFQDSDTDMTAQLTRIKGTDAQAVICWGIGPAPALVCKNMKQLEMTIPLIQSHGVANMRFIEDAGDAANGVVLPAGKLLVADQLPNDDPQKSVLMEYKQQYEEKYQQPADTFGGHAWDAIQLILKGIREGGTDRAAIRDVIVSTQGFVGIGGVFNYSPEDHYGLTPDAFVMIKIVDGQWQLAD